MATATYPGAGGNTAKTGSGYVYSQKFGVTKLLLLTRKEPEDGSTCQKARYEWQER